MSPMPPVPDGLWFNEIAAFMGPAYWAPGTGRVQAFTKGTAQEVDFLVDALQLQPGRRVLDAGCGPGRHALELARRGCEVVGLDASPDFLALASASASAHGLPVEFVEGDVREIAYRDEFDAVISLCQGGFGLLGGGTDELAVIDRLGRALKPGGRLALTAFSSYFVVRHLEPDESFEADTGVSHETAIVRDAAGNERRFGLWTTCYTPRELRLLARASGLEVDAVYAVRPGRYARELPSIDAPEHLLLAHRS